MSAGRHADYLDPTIAATVCTQTELEIVRLRNRTPPASWSQIVHATGKSRSTCRSLWANANRKVRGHQGIDTKTTPDAGYDSRIVDRETRRVGAGVPIAGFRGAITGTQPGTSQRAGDRAEP